jgi:hypothetical protein
MSACCWKDHPELEECVLEFVACVNERRTAFNAQRTVSRSVVVFALQS